MTDTLGKRLNYQQRKTTKLDMGSSFRTIHRTSHFSSMKRCSPKKEGINGKELSDVLEKKEVERTQDLITSVPGRSPTYKYHNSAWRELSISDVEALNFILMDFIVTKHTSSSSYSSKHCCDVLVQMLLSRFFPNHPLASRALVSVHHESSRGHPVVVDFLYEMKKKDRIEWLARRTSHQVKKINNQCFPLLSYNNYLRWIPHEFFWKSFTWRMSSMMNHRMIESKNTIPLVTSRFSSTLMIHLPFSSTLRNKMKPHYKVYDTPMVIQHKQDLSLYDNSHALAQNLTFRVTFEFSAGLCVTRRRGNCFSQEFYEALVIRRKNDMFYELPKGHLEKGETLQDAAERELREETGLLNALCTLRPILSEMYSVETQGNRRIEKTVHYFTATLGPFLSFSGASTSNNNVEDWKQFPSLCWSSDVFQCHGPLYKYPGTSKSLSFTALQPVDYAWFSGCEPATCEVRWVNLWDLETLYWKSNTIKKAVLYSITNAFGGPQELNGL